MKHSFKRILALVLVLASIFTIAAAAANESENNGTTATANPIKLNSTTVGTISARSDYDYYALTLKEDTAIQLTLAHELETGTPTSYYYYIKIVDASDKLVSGTYEWYIRGDETTFNFPVTGLRAGTYYIRVAYGSYVPTSAYVLSVKELNGVYEAEGNNYAALANPLTNGVATTATIGNRSDEDWFSITLPTDSAIKLNFTQNLKTDKPTSNYYGIRIFNEDGTEQNVSGGSVMWYLLGQDTNWTSPLIGLRAGSYRVQVQYAGIWSTDPYTIRYDIQSGVNETELNNYAVFGTVLKNNVACSGSLVNSSDTDWYSFSVDGNAQTVIYFNQSLKSKYPTDNYYQIYLTDESGDNHIQSWYVRGQDTSWSSGPLMLANGNYRVRVSSVRHSDETYQIKVNAKTELKFTINSTEYTINGSPKVTDVAPYIKEGRTYLPLRAVGESMNATVNWDAATRTVTVLKGNVKVVLTIGSTTYTVNGVAKTADVAPEILNGRTCLPIRYVAEALGGSLGWDPATRVVTIVY